MSKMGHFPKRFSKGLMKTVNNWAQTLRISEQFPDEKREMDILESVIKMLALLAHLAYVRY